MIETRRLKNVIFIQTILSFVLSRKIIWINLPYFGKKSEQLKKYLIRKLKTSFKENVMCKTVYKTNKLSMFCNTNISIFVEQISNVIDMTTCPAYFQKYVGKTNQAHHRT